MSPLSCQNRLYRPLEPPTPDPSPSGAVKLATIREAEVRRPCMSMSSDGVTITITKFPSFSLCVCWSETRCQLRTYNQHHLFQCSIQVSMQLCVWYMETLTGPSIRRMLIHIIVRSERPIMVLLHDSRKILGVPPHRSQALLPQGCCWADTTFL